MQQTLRAWLRLLNSPPDSGGAALGVARLLEYITKMYTLSLKGLQVFSFNQF